MKIHKEGYLIILIATILIGGLDVLFYYFLSSWMWIVYILWAISAVFYYLVVAFFRVPVRHTVINDKQIICPADGKVVVIEEVVDEEYFHGKRLQMSVFMSPLNVHVQWFPVKGIVKYVKYHAGKYLVAWDPKSSTENERNSVVIEMEDKTEVLFKQIAGAVARRIVCYCKEGDEAKQGDDYGFIKFGSRVDLLLPVGTKVKVELGQVVVGAETVLAELP